MQKAAYLAPVLTERTGIGAVEPTMGIQVLLARIFTARITATILLMALLQPVVSAPAAAQGIRTERVSFAPGTSGSVIQTRLVGQDIIDYVLNARGGQRMVIDLATDNPSAYFNLMPSGDPKAIHIGSTEGNHFDGTLPASGDWVIRVYLIRAAARRDETANLTLSIHIGGASHSVPATDFADGDAGGPDY
ncbi:hypothetical protein AB0T83_18605 [Fluviibacterium sp. DFM31]|uniref:P/Homo B domain-containing protein n=1 Tax=Meridianimarinicoccus marinus TaxID=3231483 RepID=A0ABV3LB35_9RHOB